MLLLKQQFIIKYGIRNQLYIVNPPIHTTDEVSIPRFSVIHYLDTKLENHFPTSDLYYFKDIPKNKRIHIFNITDLDNKDEVSVLKNKYVNTEIRKWLHDNLKRFRSTNLLETPNTDPTNISIFNYNLLNDLYNYKVSILSKYYRYYNLYLTYYNSVKEAISKDNDSTHFIKIDVPNNIPSYNIIDVMLKFSTTKFSRIVSDEDLVKIIDIYRWISDIHRSKSTLKNISDQDSLRIIVEFSYKGYVTYLPLHLLRSLSKESELDSNVKYNSVKVSKIFIMMLHKFQDSVNSILEGNEVDTTSLPTNIEESKIEETDNVNKDIVENQIEIKKDLEDDNSDEQDNEVLKNNLNIPNFSEIKKDKLKDISKINEQIDREIDVEEVNKLIDVNLFNFDKDIKMIDDIYEKAIIDNKDEPDTKDTKNDSTILESTILNVDYSEEKIDNLLKTKDLDYVFDDFINKSVEFKTLTSTEIRSIKKLKENRMLLKSPYDQNTIIDDYKVTSNINTELNDDVTKIDIKNNLLETNIKKEVINNFDKLYIDKLLKKDIISCVSNLEKSGIIIKDYTVEKKYFSVGDYEIHKLTIKPLTGKESTIYFRLPIVNSEGEFIASGIKYRMRKTRQNLPIVKISPIRVALNSNYSKLFISRTTRKANDPYSYLVDFIKNSYLSEDRIINKLVPGVKVLNNIKLPNVYSILSSNFNEVHTNDITLLLNFKDIDKYIDKEVLKDIESKNLIFTGYLPNKNIVVTDYKDQFYNYTDNMRELGTIDKILGIDEDKLPKPFSVMKVLGDDIPLGVCLSYYLGISGLLSVTKTKYKILEGNTRYTKQSDELVLRFSDYKLVLTTDTIEKQLLFNGYLFYKESTKKYNLKEFDNKEVFLNLLESRSSGLIHIKELNLLEELFLDNITVEVLKDMNEPTDFLKLLIRANELLNDFSHPDINDPYYSRIRGYDRVPGLLYRALTESIRSFKLKGRTNSKIELDPYKVWNYITQDSTVKIVEDINPILNIKESEIVTLTGADGLNKGAVPKMLRRYHKNEIGLTSEATVDSSDVALNTYLSPYAKIKNLRGIVKKDIEEVKENPAKAFSTSALLVPMVEHDDPKRVNFISIQNSHTIAADGYTQPILRTTYEYMIPFKAGKLYCIIADQNGEITEVTSKLLTVRYESGDIVSYRIGKQYGRMEGGLYPHFIKTPYKKGDQFKANDYLAYNESFFEPDWLDSSRLITKFGKNITVALTMNNEVFEDSSAISKELMEEMKTSVIKEKIFIIEFSKNVINILPEGTNVEPNTILFTLLDETSDYTNLSETSINMLQNISSLSPKAKYNGIIDRYEIKYNGEVNDMSPSLKKLAIKLDRHIYEETKGTDYEAHNNRVTSEYRSEGKNLNIDSLELKVFIKLDLKQGVGDKGVLAGQMKSIVSEVYTSDITTDSGLPVHCMFSYKGILNRQVNSTIMAGTTNRLIKHVSKQVADIYFTK